MGMRLALRGGAAGVVLAGLVALAGTLRPDASTGAAEVAPAAAEPVADRGSFAVTQSGEVAHPAAATTRPDSPATAPAITPGQRVDLGNGFFAERSGDTVVVHFDTQGARTRRSDKFERVVRETLPVVLGDAGRKAVARLEAGALVPAGQLLATLDAGPLDVPVGDGRTIRLQPGARAGRDGPLVVTYRAVIVADATPSAT